MKSSIDRANLHTTKCNSSKLVKICREQLNKISDYLKKNTLNKCLIMQYAILVDSWIVPNEHDRARAAARFMIASLRFTMKI